MSGKLRGGQERLCDLVLVQHQMCVLKYANPNNFQLSESRKNNLYPSKCYEYEKLLS